jgi:hypothetical protein
MKGDKIIVTKTESGHGTTYAAHIVGVDAHGSGPTEDEAVRSLANTLAAVVETRSKVIERIREKLRHIADPVTGHLK